jgi:Mn-dependent DtxR family transcriptional regulator
MSKLQKDLTAIDANKRQQNQRVRSRKRIAIANAFNSSVNVNSSDSRLTSIRGANNAKRPMCTFRMEDYLETIYELVQHKGYAPLADVAEYLNVRPPSVTTMVRRLDQSRLLNYERYRGIQLTEEGMDIAKIIHDRHSVLSEFLKLIGVSEGIANKDAESMEHHLHPQTMQKLTELVNILKVSSDD